MGLLLLRASLSLAGGGDLERRSKREARGAGSFWSKRDLLAVLLSVSSMMAEVKSLRLHPQLPQRRQLKSPDWVFVVAMAARTSILKLRTPTSSLITAAKRSQSTSSSTSALAYKALHRRITPLPTQDSPAWSAQAAVSNILYETPAPSKAPPTRHILNCLVQNEPGVLSRVSGILAARGFNIDSLVVCHTEVEDLSRMTIVLSGQDGVVEQARRQLEDLVPVWAVLDYTQAPLVQRELLLAKINILGPEYFEELLAHHREITAEIDGEIGDHGLEHSAVADFHPSKLVLSQALRLKHEHLKSITYFAHQFGGKVLDISNNNCIVELSAKPTRIDSFMKLVSPFGILESTRTGLMALPRSPLFDAHQDDLKEADEIVDASSLPPG
ncbi:hypothetical protein V499_07729 [Pseudogymnoascus sp. VKM F-103]|nr:hypothetical protein V499_07729 [Pseudogymnoascus sp. VKM F-103]